MGWAARANPLNDPRRREEERLRRILALFPDRATFEAWCTKSQIDDQHRAHLEAYLPPALRVQGAV